jgi:hypothetical protein
MTTVADEILDAPAELIEFNAVQKGLAELRKELAGVQFDVTTAAGDKAARAARSRCVSIRTSADAAYEGWNKPMLAKQREMRAVLASIKDEVKAVEEPIDAQIKAEEQRKAEIKAAKEAAEKERQKAIQERFNVLARYLSEAVGQTSAGILTLRDELAGMELTTELYDQRAGEAMALHAEVSSKLEQMYVAVLAQEQEAARLAEERANLERQRLEQEAEAKRQRAAEEARLKAEREACEKEQAELRARQKAEQDRIDAERNAENARLEALRTEQARKDAEAAAEIKRQQDEAAAALRAQQEEINRQRRELEVKQEAERRAEQERVDAEARALREKEAAERAKAEAEAAAARAEEERRQRVEFELHGPGDAEIVRVLAAHYRVSNGDVIAWLGKFNPQAIDQALAA